MLLCCLPSLHAFSRCGDAPTADTISPYTANILKLPRRSGFPLGLREPQTAKLPWETPSNCNIAPVFLSPCSATHGALGRVSFSLSRRAQPQPAELFDRCRDAGDITSRVSPCPAHQARKRTAFWKKQKSILICPQASARATVHVSSPSHPAPVHSLITQQNGMTRVPSWRQLQGATLDRRARRR